MKSEEEPIRSTDLFNNDLYEFTCSYAYFKQNKHEQTATFDIFFRKYPFKGEHVIFAGLQTVKNFLKDLKFTAQHEKYLKESFPQMEKEYFEWLRQDFSDKVTVRSIKEGQIVFANEPLISYTGPLGFVQLFETPCLNSIGFASLVATNASRMVKAVEPRKCIEFGTRRAQGPDGALSAAEYAYIGGFIGTSNVRCACKLNLPCFGTMSHAYVTAFSSLKDINPVSNEAINLKQKVIEKRHKFGFKTHEGELASFLNFALAFPHNFTTLIDTYSTLESGILNTIIVASALIEFGITKIGIRLDSGDLGQLSKECRRIWGNYIPDVRLNIVASDDLYEERLVELMDKNCEIDIFAIGTNIATCKKQPALGIVCKLVELDGEPKMKLSSSPQKATYPCQKNIYRILTDNEEKFDLIALKEEKLEQGIQIEVGTIKQPYIGSRMIKRIRLLNTQLEYTAISIENIKEFVQESKTQLPDSIFDLKSPKPYEVFMTQKYLQAFHKTHDKANQLVQESDQSERSPFKQIQPSVKKAKY